MDFKQFLAAKQALALVEHMDTLSEADAQQLFDTLDEETVEFIEAVLSEISATTARKVERRGNPNEAGAAKRYYDQRKQERVEDDEDMKSNFPTDYTSNTSPEGAKKRRENQSLDSRKARQEKLGEPEKRTGTHSMMTTFLKGYARQRARGEAPRYIDKSL